MKLEYDAALRVKKESYYNAAGTLLDETTYIYDPSGKRQVESTTQGDRAYSYTPGYQLDTVTEPGETENYNYDQNGRLTLIERDGKSLDLEHDTSDRLTEVENQTTGDTQRYIYNGNGDRIKAIEGTNERSFLVAPAVGSGLESTDLITDAAGNLLSNYIYAGGSSPFMLLDANGNPTYYLSDDMGSVIGLADSSGESSAKFLYGAFGDIIKQSGTAEDADALGGDFRFQEQWLESDTGLYYFRARDYDPKTGLFLSRDPAEPIKYEPESFNLYGFVYNNPYIYSDPTGEFTISEIGVASTVENILNSLKSAAVNQIKDRTINQARGILTNVLNSALKQLIPVNDTGMLDKIAGDIVQQNSNQNYIANWEDILIEKTLCSIIKNHVWKDVSVAQSGEPQDDGYLCGQITPIDYKDSKPDFIIKKGKPDATDGNPKAYLIGDAKVNAGNMQINPEAKNYNQFNAIMNYAKYSNGHQYVPIATYVSIFGLKDSKIKQFKKAANRYGVTLEIIRFFPK